jgi:hypothetical protein
VTTEARVDACPTCLHYALMLVAGRDLDETERQPAIRELAAHLTAHTEGRVA